MARCHCKIFDPSGYLQSQGLQLTSWRLVLSLAAITCFKFPSSYAAPPPLSSYTDAVELDATYRLFWTADTDATKPRMSFAVSAKTKGFIGFGLSEVGGMVGSDVMVAWIASGQVQVTDRFIFSQKQDGSGVRLDRRQDWVAVGGEESVNGSTGETWTTIHFWRYLDTGDCNDRPIVSGQLSQVIWSFGHTDSLSYHGPISRGGQAVMFIPSASQQLSVPEQPTSHLNLTLSNFAVPTNYTTYMCQKFQTNILVGKKHGISWSAIINTNHPTSVHHIVLYSCSKAQFDKLPSSPRDCMEQTCGTFVAVWTVGGKQFDLPSTAGLPFDASTNQYLDLQMHYTNPTGIPDIVDSSGLSLGLTSNLRPNDAGIMPLGPYMYGRLIRIPPKMPAWTHNSVCSPWCTSSQITPGSSLKIIASNLHLHTLGRQLRTTVHRGGAQMAVLGRQDYYDFNFQQTVSILPEFELLPGDELHTKCVWDSQAKKKFTVGGPSTAQEMCFNFLMFYPLSAGKGLTGGCFDACIRAPPPILAHITPDMYTPHHIKGINYNICGAFHNSTQTCEGSGYGANLPLKFQFGCRRRSFCSSCLGLVRHSSVAAIYATSRVQQP